MDPTVPKSDTPAEEDAAHKAIRFRAYRHNFSLRDIRKGISDRRISKKLKKSKKLEDAFTAYVTGDKKGRRPRELRPRHGQLWEAAQATVHWSWRIGKWLTLTSAVLAFLNYLPGPTQHFVEFSLARTIYDIAPGVSRMPPHLETYAHSANIVDSRQSVMKAYGKRRVTDDIPAHIVQALLACEDHYFIAHERHPWYVRAFLIHGGVSWINLFGAVKDTLAGKARGASTLVMQNAKKILGNDDRTIGNKLEEIVIAYMLVSRFGKAENLKFYMNTVPVGNNLYGFSQAARSYFNRNLEEINIQQAVAIASFIPNHNRQIAIYAIVNGKTFAELSEPARRHAEQALEKINTALLYLRSIGEITETEYADWVLKDEESIRRIGFRNFKDPLYGEEEWTTWNTIREAGSKSYQIDNRKVAGPALLLDEKGDIVVQTGVDIALTEKIKEIIAGFVGSDYYRGVLRTRNINTWEYDKQEYQKRGLPVPYQDFDGFLGYLNEHITIGVIIANTRGEIIAYVGGSEFVSNSAGGDDAPSNVVIDIMSRSAKIAPGSTIKPVIAYYAMLGDRVDLSTNFADKPLEHKYVASEGREVWMPRNWYHYDGNRYMGREYSLLEAQVLSVNTIFARLYSQQPIRNAVLVGFDEIGLDYNKEDARYWPFGIGVSDVPVQQWVGLYGAFLDGYYREPSFVSRVMVNDRVVYDREQDARKRPILLFDQKQVREMEMFALYEVCNRGSGATMGSEFPFHRNLVSGKTGTESNQRCTLFVSHFNPYRDRLSRPDKTITMMVAVTTETGGLKRVGLSTEGPTKVAGRIYNHIFRQELQTMTDEVIQNAKNENAHFGNNHVYWANVNRYINEMMNGKHKNVEIRDCIIGVDGYRSAIEQILNKDNGIYTGRDDLFKELIDYYCDQEKVVSINAASPAVRTQKR
ncbi:MAG: penicillin-binding protein [Desulfobacteraceae bacterium]|nr:MAG: penicillin-binding protein [Desulfobacteraceae bacterium]